MFEIRSDTNGEFHYILPNWRLNEKVAAARVDYLASIPESISGPEIEKEMSM